MPSIADVRTTDPILTNVAIQFAQEPDVLVADMLFPYRNVPNNTGRYTVYEGPMMYRVYNTLRGDGAPAREMRWTLSKNTFYCEEFALRSQITDLDRISAISPVDLDADTTAALTYNVRLSREVRARDAVWASCHANDFSADHRGWDTGLISYDPFTDVNSVKRTMQMNIGRSPNLMILSPEVKLVLSGGTAVATSGAAAIINRIMYTTPVTGAALNEKLFAQMFDVENCVTASAMGTLEAPGSFGGTAAAPKIGASNEFIWNNYITGGTETPVGFVGLFCQNPGGPGLKDASFGVTFLQRNFAVKRFREEMTASEHIECGYIGTECTVVPAAGEIIEVIHTPTN